MSYKEKTKKNNKPSLLILPSLAWFACFLIIPLCIVLTFSFMHKGAYGKIVYEIDFSNYTRAFEPIYLKIIGRSLTLALSTSLLCLSIAYPLAYLMARSSKSTKQILLGLVIIPFWTNFIIRIYALKLVLGEEGILNRLLLKIGLIHQPLAMTNNTLGVEIGMVYNYLPFMILPLFVALEKLDFTLLDAAYDLGANKLQMIIKILFPLSLPGVITGTLFVFIPAFGEFVIPDLMGGSQNMFVGNLITETFLKSRDWPFGSAISSFLVLIAMCSFVFVLSREAKSEELNKSSSANEGIGLHA